MTQPNIIFLHSHNTGQYVQPYGHAVPTPNLQRLAEEGMLFRKAFAAAPTCSPSRASFLSGHCPHSAGLLGLAHRGFPMANSHTHMVHTMREAGYFTALAGVEHTAQKSEDVGYDKILSSKQGAEDVAPAVAEFLTHRPKQPFFMSVGLRETHIPYPDPNPANHPSEDERYCMPPLNLPDVPVTRTQMAAFKASARVMDDGYGQVLDALDAAGLAENTLVCCFSDHGLQWPLNMCNLTDHGIAVYLVLRGPGGFQDGKVSDSLVSLIDLAPTVYELARIEFPSWVQGRSLRDLADSPDAPHHEEIFSEVNYHAAYEPQRCVRTERYKYIRRYDNRDRVVLTNFDDVPAKTYLLEHGLLGQPRHQELLFDLIFDPAEANNLVNDPSMAAVLNEMRGRLGRWMQATDDPLLEGPIPPPRGAKYNDPNGQSCREDVMVAE